MSKLLIICGPTATGKTKFALRLAKKFNGELISADSRQVYKEMDIGTGKDIPNNFKFKISNLKINYTRLKSRGILSPSIDYRLIHGLKSAEFASNALKNIDIGYYTSGEIRLWGYDLVDPKDEFSVAQYTEIINEVLKNICKRKKLPILVGGTGLYIKAIVDGIDTISIPQDKRLRKTLIKNTTNQLFEMLAVLDPVKAANMNESDRKNSRRLIRAIEVAQNKLKTKKLKDRKTNKNDCDTLFVGISLDKEELDNRIDDRVEKRLKIGFEDEFADLLSKGMKFDMQSASSLGYRQWKGYIEGKVSKSDATKLWKIEEKKYAKRQLTWFKRDNRVNWFDVDKHDFAEKVEKTVGKWYKAGGRK